MSISNAEHLEEILHEANAYGIRLETIQLASKYMDDDKTLKRIDAFQLAFHKLKQILNNEEV